MQHIVCNYGRGGNRGAKPIYKVGEPGSDCLEPSDKYPGLCKSTPTSEENWTVISFREKMRRTKEKRDEKDDSR